jgi:phospholipase/carboxylesterase
MSALDSHVHVWVPSERSSAPTLLLLHGTGGDERDLIPLARAVLPGAALLEHGAPRFFRRLAEGVFDQADLLLRTESLGDFIQAAAERYAFDLAGLHAVGYSNGANIASSLMLRRPSVLAGAVLFRAMVPFEPDTLPALDGKRVLISAGSGDQMIPRPGTERLAAILTDAGAEVEVEWQAASHGLVAGDVKAAQRFLSGIPEADSTGDSSP